MLQANLDKNVSVCINNTGKGMRENINYYKLNVLNCKLFMGWYEKKTLENTTYPN